jgi:hypothetical protein
MAGNARERLRLPIQLSLMRYLLGFELTEAKEFRLHHYPRIDGFHDREGFGTASGTKPFAIMKTRT